MPFSELIEQIKIYNVGYIVLVHIEAFFEEVDCMIY